MKLYAGHSKTDAYHTLVFHLTKKAEGPKVTATQVKVDAVLDRLTDSSKYTGTHKHRFNSDGTGRGILGRDQPSQTADLSQLVNRKESNIRGVPVNAALAAEVPRTNIDVKRSFGNLNTKSTESIGKSNSYFF